MDNPDFTELAESLASQREADLRYARLLQRTEFLLRLRLRGEHRQPAAADEPCRIYAFPSPREDQP